MKRKLESPQETIAEQIDSVFQDLHEKEASLSMAGKDLFWGQTLSLKEIRHCKRQVKQFKKDCMDLIYFIDIPLSMLLLHRPLDTLWITQVNILLETLLTIEITTFEPIRLLLQEYKHILESMQWLLCKLKTCVDIEYVKELKEHIMTLKQQTSRKKLF